MLNCVAVVYIADLDELVLKLFWCIKPKESMSTDLDGWAAPSEKDSLVFALYDFSYNDDNVVARGVLSFARALTDAFGCTIPFCAPHITMGYVLWAMNHNEPYNCVRNVGAPVFLSRGTACGLRFSNPLSLPFKAL